VETAHQRMYQHIIYIISNILHQSFSLYIQDINMMLLAIRLYLRFTFCVSLCFRPVFSEGNQLFIQFLSDLSLTADGFIGHYKFRPKKFPSTTVPPTTTAPPTTTRPIRKYRGQFSLIILDVDFNVSIHYRGCLMDKEVILCPFTKFLFCF